MREDRDGSQRNGSNKAQPLEDPESVDGPRCCPASDYRTGETEPHSPRPGQKADGRQVHSGIQKKDLVHRIHQHFAALVSQDKSQRPDEPGPTGHVQQRGGDLADAERFFARAPWGLFLGVENRCVENSQADKRHGQA